MKYVGFQEFDDKIEPWPVTITDILSAEEAYKRIYRKNHPKLRWRAMMRAGKWRAKNRSQKAIGRPIRRVKRKIEKARRYTIKSGVGEKIIQFVHQKVKEMQEEEKENVRKR